MFCGAGKNKMLVGTFCYLRGADTFFGPGKGAEISLNESFNFLQCYRRMKDDNIFFERLHNR